MKTKRFLSILLSLVLVLGMFPGMSLTASAADSTTEITPSNTSGTMTITLTIAAAQTEELLTTITATGKEQASYSTANVATVSFSYTAGWSSQYRANWGWWGNGWTATVNAAEGYTITKCVFYDDQNRTATDSEAPFVVKTTEEDKTPQVNGTPILAYTSKGIKKIEVYGYATPAATHSVTITAGDHMTKTADSGEASQIGLSGAMTDVVYTADDGYYFPENYSVATVNGISVTRNSYTQITVSGTPSADATITLTAPTAKTTPAAPTTAAATDCTTADNNDGTLTGVTTAMEYKKSDAADWTAGTGSDITGLVPGTYYVRVKATETTNASTNQELTIKGFISYTVTYKVVNGSWDEGEDDAATADKTVILTGHDGDTLKLTAAQIPAVGSKPNDTYKAGSWDTTPSADTEITADTTYTYTYAQKDSISQTVTFKVVNGSWNDETTTDKTVTLTGYEGDTLKLAANQIPAVGTKPNDTYKAGSWNTTPSKDTAITAATTYTYTYAQKDSISQTVTFKVVNGSWDDETTADKTVTLTGYEGDTLKLAASQIPTVGTKPNGTYKAGSWDVTPSTETEITAATTYTYTYAQKDGISQTVTFKVVNGSWNDETTADKTVTLTGYEGDTLKLAASQIPTVGTKPNDTYKAGSWDVTPSTETEITAATTYTYTYAQKEAATVTKAPEAKTLTYTGSAQSLVTAGSAEGGEMQYALGTATKATQLYTTSIPTATNAGTYYVWYKVVGDENHSDTTPASVTVTIQRRSSGGGSSTTTVTVPVTSDAAPGTVPVKASVSGTTATVTKLTDEQLAQVTTNKSGNKDADAETETNSVVIDVSGVAKDVKTATIPTETVKAVEETGSNLKVTLTDGSVEFDATAQAIITDEAKGTTIQVNLDAVKVTTLTSAQQSAVESLEVEVVLDAYVTSNGQRISDFKGGSATLSVPYTLKDGQAAQGIVVWYVASDGTRTQVDASYDGKNVVFTVPHFSNYVIAYDAAKAAACPQDTTCPISAFTDARTTAWYHDGVHWAIENSVMNGVGDGKFAPNGITTRAQVVTMLWRLEGSPAYVGMSEFSDVDNEQWYGPAIRWASAEGIVNGYDDGRFGANDAVTREQLVTILYRYAQYKKMDVSVGEDTNILSYDDAFDVSEWAIPAMQWACGSGIVNGIDKNGTLMLAPSDASTRAVVATMFWRFSK